MDASTRIRDLVELPPVQTVIRLDDRRSQAESISTSFVFTSEVRGHVSVLTDALRRDTGQGYFLQGDFGSGKSHFLAVLAAWLSNTPGTDVLDQHHEGLSQLRATGRRFLVADVSLINHRSTTSLEQIVVLSIENALAEQGIAAKLTPLAVFRERLVSLLREERMADEFSVLCDVPASDLPEWLSQHPREAYTFGVRFLKTQGLPLPEVLVEDRLETFERVMAAVREAGFAGLVLLFDELSEFFRAKPDAQRLNEDARILQFLGEQAASTPLWIVGAVQESIERTGDIATTTFRKIKDRFPVKLTLSTVHIRDLIAQRLVQHKPGSDDGIKEIHEAFRREFPTFAWPFSHFRDVYPVHPITLHLLEGLGDLFSEHRGIVDFVYSQVAGDPRRHIPGILERPCRELLAPDSIYEHFEQRLMEFSALNVYPRHVVPHLDEVIDRVLDEEDRALAKRLIRILVLYQIHPTESVPTVRGLTELVACMLAAQDPNLSVQFVAEAVLDPLVDQSRFLSKRPSTTGDALDTIYELVTKDDPGKTLKAKIEHTMQGIRPDDTRLLTSVFAELPESMSWPGPGFWLDGLERTVVWQQSQRRVLALVCERGSEEAVSQRIRARLADGGADFAVVFHLGGVSLDLEHTAVWRVANSADEGDVLREYLAVRMVAEQLRPTNPAEAPLVDLAADTLRRLAPAARQVAFQTLYDGGFDRDDMAVESAALQLRRFDRILEAAGDRLLEQRYPRFLHVAPRGMMPSPRLYQALLEQFVVPGSLSLRDAAKGRLSEAIDGLAAPLGLVQVHRGVYRFSPQLQTNPLLAALFSLLRPTSHTPIAEIEDELMHGVFGLPRETLAFLVTSLACSGMVSLISHGRTVPLEFIRLTSFETTEALALGELIGDGDREFLMRECLFLAPDAGWETFGLKQQREAWQAAVDLKEKGRRLCDALDTALGRFAEFSAFDAVDVHGMKRSVEALQQTLDEVKVSYSARDGLERFLRAWRQSGLTPSDLAQLRGARQFFERYAEQFVFVHHFVRHRAVQAASDADPALASLRDTVIQLLGEPDLVFGGEANTELSEAFATFREAYAEAYLKAHSIATGVDQTTRLSKGEERTKAVLQRLARVDSLDRPPGLEDLLRRLTDVKRPVCQCNVRELLLRSAVCDCGFQIGNEPARTPVSDPATALDACLEAYVGILRSSQVLEAAQARAYAVQDTDVDAAARLRRLADMLSGDAVPTTAMLADLLDETTVSELRSALAGRVAIEPRSLSELVGRLRGRRLGRKHVTDIVSEWLGKADPDTVLAMDDGGAASPGGVGTPVPSWWQSFYPELFPPSFQASAPPSFAGLAAGLQEHYPADSLRAALMRLPTERLLGFVTGEPYHLQAIREAWTLLLERVLVQGDALEVQPVDVCLADAKEAGELVARIEAVMQLGDALEEPFPDGLRARLHAVALAQEPWATDNVAKHARLILADIEERAQDWFSLLPQVASLTFDDAPVVALLDAVSADVWLTAMRDAPNLFADGNVGWQRLDVETKTAAAMAHLVGAGAGDALAALEARGVRVERLSGKEAEGVADRLPALELVGGMVVHVAAFDRGAHRGGMRLAEMPAYLTAFVERELAPLRQACLAAGRRFIMTTDHGLSFANDRLTHGGNSLYERVIFRCEWGG